MPQKNRAGLAQDDLQGGMDTATRTSEASRGTAPALGREKTEPRQAAEGREGRAARTYALVGLGLFLLSWLLGGMAATQGLPALMPYADVVLGLGFALALLGAVLAGATLREIIPIGVVSGIGLFYKAQDHATHVQSGWGLGMEHLPHLMLGLILLGVAMAACVVLSFYHTRGSPQLPR
jgi:hypothetical protein